MYITAASIIKNSDRYIQTMLNSISWADNIILYDDHSSKNSKIFLKKVIKEFPKNKIFLIKRLSKTPMMYIDKNGNRNIENEIIVRNQFITTIFNNYNFDALVLIDADELIVKDLRNIIESKLKTDKYDSIALTCNHLVDYNNSLHFYEAEWNGITMVDPHVRVLKKIKFYQRGEYPEVPDCFLKADNKTFCVDGPYHFHLKYLKKLKESNHSLRFLPKSVNSKEFEKNIKKNQFKLPSEVKSAIDKII